MKKAYRAITVILAAVILAACGQASQGSPVTSGPSANAAPAAGPQAEAEAIPAREDNTQPMSGEAAPSSASQPPSEPAADLFAEQAYWRGQTSIPLRYKNNGTEPVWIRDRFKLERLEDGSWNDCTKDGDDPPEIDGHYTDGRIKPGKQRSLWVDIGWAAEQPDGAYMPEGSYRLTIEISDGSFLAVEFALQSDIPDYKNGVTAAMEQPKYPVGQSELKMLVTNNSADYISNRYDSYHIEQLLSGEWAAVSRKTSPQSGSGDVPILLVSPNETVPFRFHPKEDGYELSAGYYRIVKELGDLYYAAEFELVGQSPPSDGSDIVAHPFIPPDAVVAFEPSQPSRPSPQLSADGEAVVVLSAEAAYWKKQTQIPLYLENPGADAVQIARGFTLERLEGGGWAECVNEDGSAAELDKMYIDFPVEPDETRTFMAYLGWAAEEADGELQMPEGRYRITIELHDGSRHWAEFNFQNELPIYDDGCSIGTEHTWYPEGTDAVRLYIYNNTEHELGFGYEYTIEQYQNGDWITVKPSKEIMVPSVAIFTRPWINTDIDIGLEDNGYNLTAGRYRIVKRIGNRYRAAEFEIKGDGI